MAKYKVTLYYHTSANVVVFAEDEEDAIEKAYNEISNKELLAGLIEDDSPDVKLIKE